MFLRYDARFRDVTTIEEIINVGTVGPDEVDTSRDGNEDAFDDY